MKVNEFLNRKVMYGGLPVSYGEMMADLQRVAESRFPGDKHAQQRAINYHLNARIQGTP